MSSCADGSWGSPPVRVGRRWAPKKSRYRVISITTFLFIFNLNKPKAVILSKKVCEKVEGQRVRGSKGERLGTYTIRENRTSAADEEICRPSAFAARTRKLSSCADGSWGSPPVRVGHRWAPKKSRYRVISVTTFLWFTIL